MRTLDGLIDRQKDMRNASMLTPSSYRKGNNFLENPNCCQSNNPHQNRIFSHNCTAKVFRGTRVFAAAGVLAVNMDLWVDSESVGIDSGLTNRRNVAAFSADTVRGFAIFDTVVQWGPGIHMHRKSHEMCKGGEHRRLIERLSRHRSIRKLQKGDNHRRT